MTPAPDIPADSRAEALVLGLGATGTAIARHLDRRGLCLRLADSRSAQRAPSGIAATHEFVAGPFDGRLLDGVEVVYVSPGIAPHEPLLTSATERGLTVSSDVDLFVSANRRPIVAVTGSNGKSTVVSLVAALLNAGDVNARAGGNLGTPMLELLDDKSADVIVLELSSFQLARTDVLPARAATVLNLTDDHLDWHGSRAAYRAAKRRILQTTEQVVVNRRQPELATSGDAPAISFGLDCPPTERDYGLIDKAGATWLARGQQPLVDVSQLYSPLAHECENALAALALVDSFALPKAAMARALAEFTPLPHRAALVAERDGVRWIDNSKATNPGAALASLASLDGPFVWIAGGDPKGADLSPLADAAGQPLRAAILMGAAADTLASLLPADVAQQRVDSMAEAVQVAARLAQAGDTVLLAPACASQDMFRDYADRGRQFQQAVEGLPSC